MYLSWKEKIITDFTDENINSLYNEGYVFTRPAKGLMKQTRSLRIDLSKFELSSENKRILKKTEDIRLKTYDIPYEKYDWTIGKLGKDFYETKFGVGTFSANKIKELLTTKHNFNKLFSYVIPSEVEGPLNQSSRDSSTSSLSDFGRNDSVVGYCICYETNELLHYSYPFYNLQNETNNLGMGMMLKAIVYAKENGKKYIYLGSAQRPTDIYKLQFTSLEWFDGKKWSENLDELKNLLKK